MRISPFAFEASRTADRQQKAFYTANRIQLGLVLLAAAVSILSLRTTDPEVNWSGVISAVFLGTSLLLRVVMIQRGDEQAWYRARYAAEAAKSLDFQYAFGATGFERTLTAAQADAAFIERFGELGGDVLLLDSEPRDADYSEITDDMRERRAMAFPALKEAFFAERIHDQERWHSSRAERHVRRTRLYTLLMLGAQVLGLLFAIMQAIDEIDIPWGGLVGLASAVAAAFLAWSQLRQHSVLAATFQSQAMALRSFGRRMPLVDEDEWPAFVAAVEAAILADHARWQGLQGRR